MGFREDLQRGKKGEEKVMEIMKQRGHNIVDLTANAQYFDLDIDFLVGGRSCELKTDYVISRTGNLFLEDYMRYDDGNYGEGYYRKSQAEYLFYYDIKSDILYIYPFEELRKYISSTPGIPVRSLEDANKTVYGYCLNKDAVEHQTIYMN